MKDEIVKEVYPVAMPPLSEMLQKVIEHKIPIYV